LGSVAVPVLPVEVSLNNTSALSGVSAKSLDEVFERTGLAAKWEAKGKALGLAIGEAKGDERAIKVAKNLINLGLPLETVASATELDPEKVKALYQNKVKNRN